MTDLDDTVLISRFQQKKRDYLQHKSNLQKAKLPQELSKKKIDRQKYIKEIKANFFQDNQLGNLNQLKPFQNNEEIYEIGENLIIQDSIIPIPKMIQDDIDMALSSHIDSVPFFQRLFDDLVAIVVNNILFLWDYENDIFQKKQFLQRIIGIGIGKPDPNIFHNVQQILVVSLEQEIQFIEIINHLKEISLSDLEMTIKADRKYSQILISKGRIFLGSTCGLVKEIIYCKSTFNFFLSNQKLQIKSGGSIFMDMKKLFFKNEIKAFAANNNFLFALNDESIGVYELLDTKINFLYYIQISDIINKLETERIYLPDKSNWKSQNLEMIGLESLSHQINLIIFTKFGIRLYVEIDEKDFYIHFIKFQGSNNPNIAYSKFDESFITFKTCSDGLSTFVCEFNQNSQEINLICYQLSKFQEIQKNFQPPKNETLQFQEVFFEDCEMLIKQDFEFKKIYQEIQNDIDLIQQTYLKQKKLILLYDKGIQKFTVQRPLDKLKEILFQLDKIEIIPRESSSFLHQEIEVQPKQQFSEVQMQNFIAKYGLVYVTSMLIQLYCNNDPQTNNDQKKSFKNIDVQENQQVSDLKNLILNMIENINKKENMKFQATMLYLSRILRPYLSRTLIKDDFENFELDEVYFVRQKIKDILNAVKYMNDDINDIDKKSEIDQFVQFICECFSLIIFLSENIGFRKIKLQLDQIQKQNLDILTFGDIIDDPDHIRPLLRVFLKTRDFMDKSKIIKNNFPSFFSNIDQQIYKADILIIEEKFDLASKILEQIEQISDNSIYEYFYTKYLPKKQINYFLNILFSQIEQKQVYLKNKYLSREQIEAIEKKLEFYKNFIFDIFAELIVPRELEILDQKKQPYNQDDKIEKYGIFKGYTFDEKSILIQNILKQLNSIKDEKFHMNVFKTLIDEKLADYLNVCNSEHFIKIKEFVKDDPINVLKAGQFYLQRYKYFSERNQNYDAYLFANDLFLLEQDDGETDRILLNDRKIYLFIAIQNLEIILKTEKDIQQRSMIQDSLRKILEQQKSLNLQSFVLDSIQRNQKIIIENIENDEISNELNETIYQMSEFIDNLEKNIHPLKYLIEIIQKFQLYDCYLYFSEFQSFTNEFLQSIYRKFFKMLFNPKYFKRRCMDTLITIHTNLKSLDQLQFFSIKIIIETVENINLKNPLYLEFFDSLKNTQDNFSLHNPEMNPFWLFSVLIQDLKYSEHEILEVYISLMEKQYNDEEYDSQLYFLVTVIAIIQNFISQEKLIHSSKNLKKYLQLCKNKIADISNNLRCDSELTDNLEHLIDSQLLPSVEQNIILQQRIQNC